MARHVILGKGAVGSTLARHLAAQGHEVLVLSRSGGAPTGWTTPASQGTAAADTTAVADTTTAADTTRDAGTVDVAAVDGTDGAALAAAARGAAALYNCANPPYHRWPQLWPPIADALLTAAERTGAVLVTAGNLYGYGPVTGPMAEASPLRSTERKGRVRADMWTEAKRRHDAGRLRATEVRASDYLGPGAVQSHAGARLLGPLLAGRTVRPIGSADQPHSWTYLPDFAAALAAAATTQTAWGHPWHAPSPEPLTFRELARRFAAEAGAAEPRIAPLPMGVVRALGVAVPLLRELAAVGHQFTAPFVLDSTASQVTLGLAPTPWSRIVAETLAAWRRDETTRRAPADAR